MEEPVAYVGAGGCSRGPLSPGGGMGPGCLVGYCMKFYGNFKQLPAGVGCWVEDQRARFELCLSDWSRGCVVVLQSAGRSVMEWMIVGDRCRMSLLARS